MHPFRYNRFALALLLLLLLSVIVVRAEDPVCTQRSICAPAAGTVWIQDADFASVIWNPTNMTPFDRYEKVDIYLVDDANDWQLMLQQEADISIGMMAKAKDALMFPIDLPVNRTCKVVFISLGQPLDGTHRTLNSSDFSLIRTQHEINGTLTPLPPSSTPTGPAASPSLNTRVPTPTNDPDNNNNGGSGGSGANPTPPIGPLPPTESSSHSSLSSLAIGLIVAGSVAIIIAAVAIAQVFKTRRRYMRQNAHFKTLPEPGSPVDGSHGGGSSIAAAAAAAAATAGSSEPKPDLGNGGGGGGSSGFGSSFGGAALMAGGRNSSTTVRSNTAMLQGAHALSGYSTPEPLPTIVVPLVERRASTLDPSRPTSASSASLMGHSGQEPVVVVTQHHEPSSPPQQQRSSGAASSSSISLGGNSRMSLEPVISAGDARLIADTFRKSLRRPRWEEEEEETGEDDDDEEEQDEARKAANELLRKELSEQGLDVQQTGVQRRVTIQTRPTGPEPDAAL